MRSILISAMATLAIAGCASTPEGLKTNPENKKTAVVPVNYQLAFKRITETYRECAMSPLLPIGQLINDARLYPDLKMGTFTLGASGFGTQIHQHLEISAAGEQSTEIAVFAAVRAQQNLDRYVRWAAGNASCEL